MRKLGKGKLSRAGMPIREMPRRENEVPIPQGKCTNYLQERGKQREGAGKTRGDTGTFFFGVRRDEPVGDE